MSNNLQKPIRHELEIDNSKTVDAVHYFTQSRQFLAQAIKDLEFKIAFKSEQIKRDIELLEKLRMAQSAFDASRT